MEAREGGGPRGASPHRARGAGEGIADALSREMRRAAAEDLEADYFFDCRNARHRLEQTLRPLLDDKDEIAVDIKVGSMR